MNILLIIFNYFCNLENNLDNTLTTKKSLKLCARCFEIIKTPCVQGVLKSSKHQNTLLFRFFCFLNLEYHHKEMIMMAKRYIHNKLLWSSRRKYENTLTSASALTFHLLLVAVQEYAACETMEFEHTSTYNRDMMMV